MKAYGLIDFNHFSIGAGNTTGGLFIFDSYKNAEYFRVNRIENPEDYSVTLLEIKIDEVVHEAVQ